MKIKKQKIRLHIVFTSFLFSCIVIIATTPLHEAIHWIMSDIDPYSEPVEFHFFHDLSFQNEQHILSSAFGYIVVKEIYPGSFKDRPQWMDPIQEIICICIQIIITCIIISKTHTAFVKKWPKILKTSKPNF